MSDGPEPCLTRRGFLAGSLAATVTAITGCTSAPSDDAEPSTDWVPASTDGTVAAYLDFTLSADASHINPVLPLIVPSDDRQGDGTGLELPLSNVDKIQDPLLEFPLETGGSVIGGGALSLALIGLGKLVDPARPTEDVTELVVTDDATVGLGDIDTDGVDETLRTGPDRSQFDVVGERDDYTLYGSGTEIDAFVAVDDTAVVVADTRRQASAVLDARHGDRNNVTAVNDTFASLLETTDAGDVRIGWQPPIELGQHTVGPDGADPASSLVKTDDVVASSVTFQPNDDEVTADFALEAADKVVSTTFKDRLGGASTERSLSLDDRRVTASATYAASTIGLEFVADD